MSNHRDESLKTQRARQRLKRDFIELQREKLLSINAHPLDDNLFEWHANISPTDGVYSGVYFHLILIFPHSYPSLPPQVKILTPISHPNVFNSFICLSMLREHTTTVPYEGWSSAYSVTSILMQLQSFLFADKIDQDGGYQANARLSQSAVKQSIQNCKSFKCDKCSHTHKNPWPQVEGPPDALIKIYPIPIHGNKKVYVQVQGSHCQTTHNQLVGAYAQYGCNYGKIMYEVFVDWIPNEWNCNITFGFGTEHAYICGRDVESFGYMGNGAFIYNNKQQNYSKTFGKNDTITCAIDFDTKMIYFGQNGILFKPAQYLPNYLQKNQILYPMLSFKEASVEFNFSTPKKPCQWLIDNGFKTLEQIAITHGITNKEKTDIENSVNNVNWHSHYIIPELWVQIFSHLSVQDIYNVQFVCKKWCKLVNKYNVTERTEMFCYFTKNKLGQQGPQHNQILGIGLNISESDVGFRVVLNSQMDILSLNAWTNGCRVGVWGEKLTHFLPLVMNKQHSELSYEYIIKYLKLISLKYKEIQMKSYHGKQREENPNKLEIEINKLECLQLVNTVITMMNQIVAQFVTGNENIDPKTVSMVLCEKVLIGYCYLHHLLLYLKSKNPNKIISFANKCVQTFINDIDGPSKAITRDLGKFLIYLMISSKYKWSDVAKYFVIESFTRRVRWFVQNVFYAKYDTTQYIPDRVNNSFIASKTGRRLVMFQVWFMKNTLKETLQGYNMRLGRPNISVKNRIVSKAKQILQSQSYTDYFKELNISSLNSNQSMDQLLRFAVYNSYYRGYHWRKDITNRDEYYIYKAIKPPMINVINNKKISNKKSQRKTGVLRVVNKSGSKQQTMSKAQRRENPWEIRKRKSNANSNFMSDAVIISLNVSEEKKQLQNVKVNDVNVTTVQEEKKQNTKSYGYNDEKEICEDLNADLVTKESDMLESVYNETKNECNQLGEMSGGNIVNMNEKSNTYPIKRTINDNKLITNTEIQTQSQNIAATKPKTQNNLKELMRAHSKTNNLVQELNKIRADIINAFKNNNSSDLYVLKIQYTAFVAELDKKRATIDELLQKLEIPSTISAKPALDNYNDTNGNRTNDSNIDALVKKENEPKLSKSQRRRQRKKKHKNQK